MSARADGETEIDLSWSRPSSDGGSRVTGYRIEVSDDGSGWSVLEADTSRTSHTHRGLTSGSTRYYRVSAMNSAGVGPASNTANATTESVDLPSAPQSLSARADGETEIDLSWSRPSSDGGSRITGYRIEVSEDGSAWSVLEADISRTSHTHRGLTSGSTRYYRVSAMNSAGVGPASNTANATTESVDLPGAPQSLSARADGETEIDLSWSRPSSDGGSRITGYRIEVSDDGSSWRDLQADTGSSSTRYTHQGLTGGTTRYYRVSAMNSAGVGPASNTANATTESVDAPGAPQSLSARADGETEIDLSWGRPSSDGGSRVTGYRIEVSDDGSSWRDLQANTGSSSTRYTHQGLTGGTTRYYRVSAINAAGVGPASNTANATTESEAPCQGMTLEEAIKGNHIEIVRCLVDAGADVNAKDSRGDPMLRLAIRGNFVEIVGILVQGGADPSAKDAQNDPLLAGAIKGKFTEIVRILVDASADVNAKDSRGDPMLRLAIRGNFVEIVGILVQGGADPSAKDAQNDPLLAGAIKGKFTEIVRILVDASADVNAKDSRGDPMLRLAIRGNFVEIVGILVQGGADPSAKDAQNDPMLYRAIRGQFVEIIRILVNAGADVNAETAGGDRLLTVAKKTLNEEIIGILEDAGAVE